jgi:dTMP kinase
MARKGFFICIEGLDGCGKTTQTRTLVKNLQAEGFDAVYTAEPSLGKIGSFLRNYCLQSEKRVSSAVEALLFAADRVEHLKKEVTPALNEGKIVVSDRYVYSSLAYQGATGLDLGWIRAINKWAMNPDLAVFIDVEPETAIRRTKPRKSVMENLETQRKVREVYIEFVESRELLRIDGNTSKKRVAGEILGSVLEFLKKQARC